RLRLDLRHALVRRAAPCHGGCCKDSEERLGANIAVSGEGGLMRTPANIAKHPIHPMLVAIPIGLWIFSLVCDLVYRFGSTNPNWQVVAWYTLVGVIIVVLMSAVPGFIAVLSLH